MFAPVRKLKGAPGYTNGLGLPKSTENMISTICHQSREPEVLDFTYPFVVQRLGPGCSRWNQRHHAVEELLRGLDVFVHESRLVNKHVLTKKIPGDLEVVLDLGLVVILDEICPILDTRLNSNYLLWCLKVAVTCMIWGVFGGNSMVPFGWKVPPWPSRKVFNAAKTSSQ